jgi:hypothetical protein
LGHQERFPLASLRDRYGFKEGTFAGGRGNDKVAPKAVVPCPGSKTTFVKIADQLQHVAAIVVNRGDHRFGIVVEQRNDLFRRRLIGYAVKPRRLLYHSTALMLSRRRAAHLRTERGTC